MSLVKFPSPSTDAESDQSAILDASAQEQARLGDPGESFSAQACGTPPGPVSGPNDAVDAANEYCSESLSKLQATNCLFWHYRDSTRARASQASLNFFQISFKVLGITALRAPTSMIMYNVRSSLYYVVHAASPNPDPGPRVAPAAGRDPTAGVCHWQRDAAASHSECDSERPASCVSHCHRLKLTDWPGPT